MIQDAKKSFRGGRSDAERAIAVLDEFTDKNPANTAEFIVDSETNVVRVVTFESARQNTGRVQNATDDVGNWTPTRN